MSTNESTSSSEAGSPVNPRELIVQPSAMHLPNSQLGFNLGMAVLVAQPLPTPWFNFGMNVELPTVPPPAAPPMLKFNLGMDLDLPTAAPSAAPPTPKFNFGMHLGIPATVAPPSLAVHTPQPCNLGFDLTLPAQAPAPKPFNLGINLPVQGATPIATAAPTASQPFNLGFNVPLAVAHPAPLATTSRCVGYDFDNRSFKFGCEPLAQIEGWQPELITAPQSPQESSPHAPSPQSTPQVPSPQFSPPPALPAAIANASPGPSIPRALADTAGRLERPTLKSLVGEAERAEGSSTQLRVQLI
ncbi:hypothetical protein CY34DRAFT_18650 [Suillus luteus UH-Slu-Lm8-n1]|uniref:Uncharacterized protein n=1 Tax=Suillus luteus UH-Slu-Lm8-n1 TaxID=930992 RepID=A0A0C9ZUK9_9AGAM|nr:hypothetical protein CY34DRAFT_18650 [Suillus luteus UH-Slu-Lm8-n1]